MEMHSVFVYGTLKRGFFNHHLLYSPSQSDSIANFIDIGMTAEDVFHLNLAGPYHIPYLTSPKDEDVQRGRVFGEVFKVNQPMLQALDALEGVPTHYVRETKKIRLLQSEKEMDCFIYVKAEEESALDQSNHMESYTLRDHAKYIPPPMRKPGPWLENIAKVRQGYRHNPGSSSDLTALPLYQKFRDAVLSLVRAGSSVKLAEMGCGAVAPVAKDFLSNDPKLVGDSFLQLYCIDSTMEQLKRAEQSLGAKQNVELVNLDLLRLGHTFPVHSFQAITCLDVIGDIPEELQWHCLRTLTASLERKSGSSLLLTWPGDQPNIANRLTRMLRQLEQSNLPPQIHQDPVAVALRIEGNCGLFQYN